VLGWAASVNDQIRAKGRISRSWDSELSDGTEHADGKEDDGADQFEHAADGDSDDAEWDEKQPHEGVGDDCKQGQGPAQNQEDAEEQEFDHDVYLDFSHADIRGKAGVSSLATIFRHECASFWAKMTFWRSERSFSTGMQVHFCGLRGLFCAPFRAE
jgi:hypothetical protein